MIFAGPFGGIPGFHSSKTQFLRNNKFMQIALLLSNQYKIKVEVPEPIHIKLINIRYLRDIFILVVPLI